MSPQSNDSIHHQVIELTLDDILGLRVAVLRQGTPVTTCDYPEDLYSDVVHLGIKQRNKAIATSTWFAQQCPEADVEAAIQLKGMAVDIHQQGEGLGSLLINAGLERARARGAQLVWARARDSAMGFYEQCGFTSVGDQFIDGPTAMPHHIVIRWL